MENPNQKLPKIFEKLQFLTNSMFEAQLFSMQEDSCEKKKCAQRKEYHTLDWFLDVATIAISMALLMQIQSHGFFFLQVPALLFYFLGVALVLLRRIQDVSIVATVIALINGFASSDKDVTGFEVCRLLMQETVERKFFLFLLCFQC